MSFLPEEYALDPAGYENVSPLYGSLADVWRRYAVAASMRP